MMTFLFGVSGGEFIIVILVVLLLFGSKKIPDFARMLGKGMNEFRRATDEIKREFKENTQDINEEITDSRQYLDREMSAINDKFKEETKELDPYNLDKRDEEQKEEVSNPTGDTEDNSIAKNEGKSTGSVSREDEIID